MQGNEADPFQPGGQHLVERQWLATVRDHRTPDAVRGVVRASWQRCLGARVEPDLPHAPLVFDTPALETACERTDWLPIAQRAVRQQGGSFGGHGHVVAVFDHEGRMLSTEGDPAAREGLAEINFAPGGLWTEDSAGTNGPGTALATGLPVHIVGAEHFCQAWQRWHCAAVPVRDPVTGAVLGVLDISGFREFAHPHSLYLAHALVLAIEQMLTAREAERRFRTLAKLTDLTRRYPGDAALAVDRGGRLLLASPGGALPVPAAGAGALQATLADLVASSHSPAPREVALELEALAARRGVWYPVFEDRSVVGGCLVIERPSTSPAASEGSRGRMPPARYGFADVVGHSPGVAEALRHAHAAAATALPVLLLGESGTGKEVFAQAIHAASNRRARPFVAVNCAAVPRELTESELFGYVGGAFSGARREGGVGKFEVADGGTIFLDEIGELPPPAQAALLRVLQEGEVTRLGSAQSRRIDVRVIAATNRNAEEAVAQGRLRADLYHRLNVLAIELPPLRDRPGDIGLLAARFLDEAATELGRPDASLSEALLARLERYGWPGNVRELKNLIRRLVAMATAFPLGPGDLPPAFATASHGEEKAGSAALTASAVPSAEQARLMEVVASARTMAEAARRLGVTRSTLYRRMERYGLRPERVLRPH